MPLRNKLATVLVSGCFTIAFNCYGAMDSEVSVGTSARWIDNVFFTENDRQSDTLMTVYTDISLSQVAEATEFDINYELFREIYIEDSFDSQNYYLGSANFNVHLLPNRLSWISSLSSGVTQRDSIGVDIPTNRDQRNYAETGLEYLMLNSGRDRVAVLPSVSATRFREASFNDNDRAGLNVGWIHRVSNILEAGVNCDGEKVDFTDGEGDYDSARCNVHLQRALRQGMIAVELGKRKINPALGDTIDGTAYNVDMNWVEERHNFRLSAARDIVDNTQSFFGEDSQIGDFPTEVNTDLKSLSVRKRVDARYGYTISRRDQVELGVFVDSDDVYESNQDTDRTGVNLNYTRALSRQTDVRFNYAFLKTVFADSTVDENVDYDDSYQFTLTRAFSRQLDAYCALLAETRRAQEDGQDYEVYSFQMGVEYTFR